MNISEKRLRILNLIQAGKITPQEGLTLLEDLNKLEKSKVELKGSSKNIKDGIKTSVQQAAKAGKSAHEEDSEAKAAFEAELRASIEKTTSEARKAVDEVHRISEKIHKSKTQADEMRASFADAGGKGARYFHLQVTDTHTGKSRVDVRMPVGVITAGVKMGAHFSPEIHGMDTNHLLEMISEGDIGKVMDVVDEDDCEHVIVTLE